jgi:hypothetical protein
LFHIGNTDRKPRTLGFDRHSFKKGIFGDCTSREHGRFRLRNWLRQRFFSDRVQESSAANIVSDDRASASLATGILRASGYINAMVVEGGMKAWIAQGFPVLREGISANFPSFLQAGAVLLGIVAASSSHWARF